MRSSSATEFCHCIGTALDASPELYSLDDVVEWSTRFEREQGRLRIHHLQQDIRLRAESWSDRTHKLIEALSASRVKIERLEAQVESLG